MKMVYIENVRIPSERAHAYQIVQTCAGLARLHHDVTLVTPARSTEDTFSFFGLPHLFTHQRVACWDPLSGRPLFPAMAYVLQRWSFVRALRKAVQGMTADVWYTRDPAMVDALPQSGPWALELHEAPADLSRWARIRPRVKQFIAISEGIKQWLLAHDVSASQITVAQDAFDPSLFSSLPTRAEARSALQLPEDAFVVLYSGNCYPWKGVDVAVRAWDRVPSHAWLVVVGGAEADYARLRAQIPAAVSDRVRLLLGVPRDALRPFYAAADVGLLSTSPAYDIGRLYTSPLKLFEYLAVGLPVLASDVPSLHEVLNADVARFFAFTEQAFADTLTGMMQDNAWRQAAATRAPQVAAPYTWDARAARIADALRSV